MIVVKKIAYKLLRKIVGTGVSFSVRTYLVLVFKRNLRRFHSSTGLDKKLAKRCNKSNGFFVELGANNGVDESNTLFLEKHRNWRGVLIEPVPELYQLATTLRSRRNKLFNCACVPFGYEGEVVQMQYGNLSTVALGLETNLKSPTLHASKGLISYPGQRLKKLNFLAPAMSLAQVLMEAEAPSFIDLLVVDVEGAELAVLKGMKWEDYQFGMICVETRTPDVLRKYLFTKGYVFKERLCKNDFLFVKKM